MLVLVLHQVQRDGQPAFLRQLVHRTRVVGGEIAGGEQIQAVVGEQGVALRLDHLPGFLQFVLGIGLEDVDRVHVAVGQALLQPHIGAVFQRGIVEAVLAGALVQTAQVEPGGEVFPVRRGEIDARFRLADQQVHHLIGAELLPARDLPEHAAQVVAHVQLRELGVHAVHGPLQSPLVERHAPVAAFLGDPQRFMGSGRIKGGIGGRGEGRGDGVVDVHAISLHGAVPSRRRGRAERQPDRRRVGWAGPACAGIRRQRLISVATGLASRRRSGGTTGRSIRTRRRDGAPGLAEAGSRWTQHSGVRVDRQPKM